MPTNISYTRTIRPKGRTLKFTIRQGVTYNITTNPDGTPKITKIAYRKIIKNDSKG